MNVLGNPVSVFLDSNGQPLQGGSIYIGQPNTDPTNPANQITVYQDQGLSIPLQQPIKTTNGQPSLNGQQIPVYLGTGVTTYALAALNAGGVVVMSQPNCAPFSLGGSASGNMTVKEYVAGTDYVFGTSTTLPLPGDPGSGANCFVDFDGVPQHYPDDFTLNSSRTQLVFSSPISAPNKVYLKFGTTQAVGTPAAGSVIDSSVSPNSKLYNRINDLIDVMDFGATGNGSTDDTTAMTNGINVSPYNYYPNKTFKVAGAFTLPFTKQMIMMPGAQIAPSGGGTATYNGPLIQFGYNPSNIPGWTTTSGDNYEGLSVDFGGYGPRSDQNVPIMTALNGSINIPSTATVPAHGAGVSGFAKTTSTTTGAVPLFGWGESDATNALAWGINTVTLDNGNATTVWGYEVDINISNAATNVRGIDITGGSTTTGNITEGLRIGPIGAFQSPPLKWGKGVFVDDGTSTVGIEIGASNVTGGGASGSQPLDMYYMTSGSGRALALRTQIDSGGNVDICQTGTGPTLNLIAGGAPGVGSPVVSVAKSGATPELSFFGATTVGKPTVTGSKGGNAALTSLMSALSSLGLVTDSTT